MKRGPIDLYELLRQVNSKATFLMFVNALAADFRDEQEKEAVNPTPCLGSVDGANGWYNHSIDGFLGAMMDWASATPTATGETTVSEEPSWQSFARMLYMGKYYE